jgi:hypothetical protein
MEYIIIKLKDSYAITTTQALEDFRKTGFLPYECSMKYKKYLLEHAKKIDKYKKLNTKTINIY